MTQAGSYEIDNGIGIITIDSPPVNALSINVRRAIDEGIKRFAADESVIAIVLICAGRTFFAGADISEFGKPHIEPGLMSVIKNVEACPKPVVAAIHGTALGGGFEIALACHYRVAVPSAKVGLPEVKLGILPGAGGTQRTTRLVGAAAALEMIAIGDPVPATRALELGLIDALCDEAALREQAIAFARKAPRTGALPRVRDREDKIAADRGNKSVFEDFRRKHARAFRGFKAPENIVRAIEAAVELPFDQGVRRERELFEELIDSTESKAQRYYFFAEREVAKVPNIPAGTPIRDVRRVGVIGAGTMGGGIAMNFLNAGIPVALIEMNREALDRGIGVIRKNYANSVAKGRMTAEQLEHRMGLIQPSTEMSALADVDLVIEAVFELMSVKQDVFRQIDAVAKPGAILSSNTSYLDLNEIASATKRPEEVVGLHFFSPANVMRLMEIVRGAKTAPDIITTAIKLAKTIDKVPVVAGVCHGFIANRVMTQRATQANALVVAGPTPQQIDAAIRDFGFAMGPFQMMDLVGLDVIGRDETHRTVRGDLVKLGRLGQKQNSGYYDYDEKRTPTPSAVTAAVMATFARDTSVTSIGELPAEEIVARLLYPIVNEGARVLTDGIALRASDIDVACILGYNWPLYTGGPMFWADAVGLPKVVAKLREMNVEPAKLLVDLAESGGKFTG